ncbi:MAG: hypothetical protein ACYC26_05990 [Phycisphaerales bacterium]
MSNGWKDILARSGDENLGATLIRLARQAAALHQYQVVTPGSVPAVVPDGSVGTGPDSLVPVLTDDVRREVNA